MIDFRYHVVSIIAVFLALSVGLVLGSSFFQEAAVSGLDSQVKDLDRSNQSLRRDLDSANTNQRYLNNFITAAAPEMVSGRLKGRSVVVLTLPGSDSKVTDGVNKMVAQAGGTVTGQVSVKGGWTDARQQSALGAAIGNAGSDPGAASDSVPSLQDRAAAALAEAVVRHSTSTPGATGQNSGQNSAQNSGQGHGSGATSDRPATHAPATQGPATQGPATQGPATQGPSGAPSTRPSTGSTTSPSTPPSYDPSGDTVLARLDKADFVDVTGNPESGATLTVVVTPSGAVGGDDPGAANSAYLSLARALDSAGDGTVLAGPGGAAQDGGTISALRRDEHTAKIVSSVDSADTPAGQVAVVLALVAERTTGASGQFGTVGTTDGWLPKLTDEGTSS